MPHSRRLSDMAGTSTPYEQAGQRPPSGTGSKLQPQRPLHGCPAPKADPGDTRLFTDGGCVGRRCGKIGVMGGDMADDYLEGLPPERREELAGLNKPGLRALREYLAAREAVAFLGAGVSAPLYPLWDGLIAELVDAAADRMSVEEAATCRTMARESPEEVVEIVKAVVLPTTTRASWTRGSGSGRAPRRRASPPGRMSRGGRNVPRRRLPHRARRHPGQPRRTRRLAETWTRSPPWNGSSPSRKPPRIARREVRADGRPGAVLPVVNESTEPAG